MPDSRILVVGTTTDYISYIDEHYPDRVIFLTDRAIRGAAFESPPKYNNELIIELADFNSVKQIISEHLKSKNQIISGLTCYDCEWLTLTAQLAEEFKLPYPSLESVKISRSKYLTKRRWLEDGVKCSKIELIYNGWQAIETIKNFGGSIVLKPVFGSGSELTFLCRNNYEVSSAYHNLLHGLDTRKQNRLYNEGSKSSDEILLNQTILAEEYIEGREYSADFIIRNDEISIIRIAKKIQLNNYPFGTTLAYFVPATLPEGINNDSLAKDLKTASQSLGLEDAVCMVDFKINSKDEIIFLELTPRIGGDCLPPLIKNSCGLDTIGLALDFAEGKEISVPENKLWTEMIGLRIFAGKSGTLKGIDFQTLPSDPNIKEIYVKYQPGHEIILPPDDYNSWMLGHIIFQPVPNTNIITQCQNMLKKLYIEMECYCDQKFSRTNN